MTGTDLTVYYKLITKAEYAVKHAEMRIAELERLIKELKESIKTGQAKARVDPAIQEQIDRYQTQIESLNREIGKTKEAFTSRNTVMHCPRTLLSCDGFLVAPPAWHSPRRALSRCL